MDPNILCRGKGHQWDRFEITAVPGAQHQSIAYDRCIVCGTERETIIEMTGTTGNVSYNYKPQPTPEDLAADLQALRAELREEVTS